MILAYSVKTFHKTFFTLLFKIEAKTQPFPKPSPRPPSPMTADNATLWNSLPDWNLEYFDLDDATNKLTNNSIVSNVCESKNLIMALLILVVLQFLMLFSFIVWYVCVYPKRWKRKLSERIVQVEAATEDADL